jgi:hypothetical protein
MTPRKVTYKGQSFTFPAGTMVKFEDGSNVVRFKGEWDPETFPGEWGAECSQEDGVQIASMKVDSEIVLNDN